MSGPSRKTQRRPGEYPLSTRSLPLRIWRRQSGPDRSPAGICWRLYLERVERFNPALNAIVTLDADRARAEADAADTAIAHGDNLGPLHGVPITIKDSIETAGHATTSGAKMLADYVPERDADRGGQTARGRGDRLREDRTCPSLPAMPSPSTSSSARPTTRGTPSEHRAVRRAEPRRRSRPGSPG